MQLPDDSDPEGNTTRKAVWLLLAVALNTLELFIPRIPFLPWLKPGLANCITMIWIIEFGMVDSLMYTLVRVWISSFYFGFSLVTVFLALSGGLFSTAVMGCAWNLLGRRRLMGTVGMGIIGALAHNTGQIFAVFAVLTRSTALFYQFPFMAGASILFGGFAGIITPPLHRLLVASGSLPCVERNIRAPVYTGGAGIFAIAALTAGATFLVAVEDAGILALCAAAATAGAFFARGCTVAVLRHPLRFGAMFFFIAFVHLLFTGGMRLGFLPFVTWEGVQRTAAQWLRLWTWLEIGLMLEKLHCNELLFKILGRLFPRRAQTVAAGLIALEYFPAVLSFVQSSAVRGIRRHGSPAAAPVHFVEKIRKYIVELMEEGAAAREKSGTASG